MPYSDERLRQRSTLAHNTVEIDSFSSSEVWGDFRVAKRAYPLNVELKGMSGRTVLRAAHNGYKRISKNIIHHRTWSLEDNKLIVEDYVTGSFNQATGRLLFSPEVTVEKADKRNSWQIILPNKQVLILTCEAASVEIIDSTYHPMFGQSLRTKCLVYTVAANKSLRVSFTW